MKQELYPTETSDESRFDLRLVYIILEKLMMVILMAFVKDFHYLNV